MVMTISSKTLCGVSQVFNRLPVIFVPHFEFAVFVRMLKSLGIHWILNGGHCLALSVEN